MPIANDTFQSPKVARLRHLLAEKFPAMQAKAGGILRTGLADVDAAEGGLRRAALTELSTTPGAGAVFIHAMLRALCRERCFAALVDAARSFEPDGATSATLARLLVVFCPDAMQAVKAADLLLRDGNLSLVMLDLQGAPPRELQRIPANTWHRLQRLTEQTTAAVVVLTPQPMVEAAQVRITAGGKLDACGATPLAARHHRGGSVARFSATRCQASCAVFGSRARSSYGMRRQYVLGPSPAKLPAASGAAFSRGNVRAARGADGRAGTEGGSARNQ